MKFGEKRLSDLWYAWDFDHIISIMGSFQLKQLASQERSQSKGLHVVNDTT
jgi:hypothetical protein